LVPHIEEGAWAEGFENKVLRTQEEVTGEWRSLHNEELNLLAPELFFLILAHPVYKM